MATVGGDGVNENMGTGFAVIDLENMTSSGSFMNIRTTAPDLVSWSDVPLVDDPGTAIDERVFFTDPSSVSNRATVGDFRDGWVGQPGLMSSTTPTARVPSRSTVSPTPETTRTGTMTLMDRSRGLGNEPFRVRTGAAGGTFSHGSPVLDSMGQPTGEWDIDIEDIPNLQYIPDQHFSATRFLKSNCCRPANWTRFRSAFIRLQIHQR